MSASRQIGLALLFVLAITLAFLPRAAHALDPIYTGYFSDLALSGYDPVAYFKKNQPVEGDKAFEYDYQGARWRFENAENRAAFIAEPAKYAPQFGGYCAWAVAQGNSAAGDPQHWKIVSGKLYLNYNADIQKKWEAERDALIVSADQRWPELLKSD